MKQFLDKIAKIAETIAAKENIELRSVDDIIEGHKDEMIPIFKLLADYEHKITVQRYFHVAVARLMELSNHLQKVKTEEVYILGYAYLIQALHPFIPHLASEI